MYKIYFGTNLVLITDKNKWFEDCPNALMISYNPFLNLGQLCDVIEKSKVLKRVYFIDSDIENVFQHLKSYFQVIESAGGLVKNSEGECLVIKKRGKWDLPKGKVESFEQCYDAAIRETYEETGLLPLEIVSILPPTYHVYWEDGKHILKKTYWYEMFYPGNETPQPQEIEKITVARWVKTSELKMVTDNTFYSVIDVLKSAKLI